MYEIEQGALTAARVYQETQCTFGWCHCLLRLKASQGLKNGHEAALKEVSTIYLHDTESANHSSAARFAGVMHDAAHWAESYHPKMVVADRSNFRPNVR